MSNAGKAHMGRVAQLACVLCKRQGRTTLGVHVHHIREGQGAAQRASDFLTVALCPDCHTGPNGVHGLGRKGFYARYKIEELDLLADTIEALEA
jgi:hypothetical protein